MKTALSHIACIRCQNFAGSTGQDGGELQVDLSAWAIDGETPKPNLVVVTGETGHGKVGKHIMFDSESDLIAAYLNSLLYSPCCFRKCLNWYAVGRPPHL